MKMASIFLMLGLFASASASADVKFEFVQSQSIASPAAAGLKDGLIFKGPAAKKDWPDDVFQSVPESRIGKTKLAMQYSIDHSYPAYRIWVRAGNAITVTSGALLIGLIVFGRGVKYAKA